MYGIGDVIDGKYEVTGMCSDTGGMGTILFIESVLAADPFQLVLKYCKESDAESLDRFKREVRTIEEFTPKSLLSEQLFSNRDARSRHRVRYRVTYVFRENSLRPIAMRSKHQVQIRGECRARVSAHNATGPAL